MANTCSFCCREICICSHAPPVVREMLQAAHNLLSQLLIDGGLKTVWPPLELPQPVIDAKATNFAAQQPGYKPMVIEALTERDIEVLVHRSFAQTTLTLAQACGPVRHRVRLETGDRGLVHLGDMPPFERLPEVILWGDRVFMLYLETQEPLVYQEVFSYALP